MPRQQPKFSNSSVIKNDDELEAGMCALFMRFPESRISMSLDEAMSLLQNDTAKDIAAAILTENPEGLEELWLNIGDTEKIGFMKLGEIFCSRMSACNNDAERFMRIYSALKRGSIERRIAEIKSMPPDKQNTDELFALYIQRGHFSR